VSAPQPAAALSNVEIAYGVPLGYETERRVLARLAEPATPRDALEAVLRQALTRPPCAISFSGGRDSSALLAIATAVARREALPDPIPVTLRFPGSAAADETDWQSLVLDRLGLPEWVRIDVLGDDFDAVGPIARKVLSAHGLMWPFNAHFHAPIIETAAGGSLVTGFGGDEVGLSSATSRAEQVLAGRRRPHPSDILTAGLALSPQVVRRAVYRRRVETESGGLPWLTRAGQHAVRTAAAATAAAVPLGWNKALRRAVWRSRYFTVCQRNFAAMGATADVEVFHPFVSAPVLDALAAAGGFAGLGSRANVMRILCGTDLPDAVVTRRSKGTFSAPVWTTTARAFATQWSGDGVDRNLVDVDRLREHWAADEINLLSTTLLQAAWLHDYATQAAAGSDGSSGRSDEQGHGSVHV
jgi:asparagine synthase (glutamine-hydrolysing)